MLPVLSASAAEGGCAGERLEVADEAVPACGILDIEAPTSLSLALRIDEATYLVQEVGPAGGLDIIANGRLAFLTISDSSGQLDLAAADIPAYAAVRKNLIHSSSSEANLWLEPGEYRVNLVVIGGPGHARLRFSELDGSATYLPSVPANAITEEPAITPSIGSGPAVWAGDDHALPSDGLSFFALWTRHPAHVFSEGALCVHAESAPPPSPVAYAPGCPGTDFIAINVLLPVTSEIITGVFGGAFADEGTLVGLGGHITATVPAMSAGAMAFWLGFEPAA
ncbi:MAG: hypothetical protein ACRDH9_11945 [Actinomycetota bacterium]